MRVTCPCCKGDKRLPLHENVDGIVIVTLPSCGHCQGEGTIESEILETECAIVYSDGSVVETTARLVPRYPTTE